MDATNPDAIDILILGQHPCAALAASVLKFKGKLKLLHATIPGDEPPDRLVLINPELFKLHELLKPLQRKLDLTPIYGIRFLGDDADTASEHRAKSPEAFVTRYSHFRQGIADLAQRQGVELRQARSLEIDHVDERGVELRLDGQAMHPRMLLLSGPLSTVHQKILGMPEQWEPELLHRYVFVRCSAAGVAKKAAKPTIPMSLNVAGSYAWGWMLPHGDEVQFACSMTLTPEPGQAAPSADAGLKMLQAWINTLKRHEIVSPSAAVPLDEARSMDLPLAGALAHEGVASRTLLIGPAGGFFSACAEDIYPTCWSGLFAADVARKALTEPHLQDALGSFRHKWRTTLGDYLRGPQQNLRFLLPLVYRNPVMTDRLAEAILSGKSVVR